MYCDVSSVRQVAVYCASSFGRHPLYADVAAEFGRILAERNIGLVYGGSGTGTMQSLAEAVLANGGEVTGVFPSEFPRELLQSGLTRTIEADSLAERKELMLELADAVVALPGGFGTLDELFEAAVLVQTHKIKPFPIILYDSKFWAGLIDWVRDQMVSRGFLREEEIDLLTICDTPEEVLEIIGKFKV